MTIKTSINVKYDSLDTSILYDYFATSAHSSLVFGVLNGIVGNSKTRAHIAYGAYGSGKSYISSILCGLLNKVYSTEELSLLLQKFRLVDERVIPLIEKYINNEIRYIPVILNGNVDNIAQNIVNQLWKTIKDTNIQIIIPGMIGEIQAIIKRWETHFQRTYLEFVRKLASIKVSIDDFMSKLVNGDARIVEWFSNVYSELSSGSIINVSSSISITELLDHLCTSIRSHNLGIFIVHDEFGRYLEDIDSSKIGIFMQSFQNIAELANNGVDNLSLLFVAHKSFGYYFLETDRELRSEFAKVEKRFSTYEIKSDYSTFLTIVSQYFGKLKLRRNHGFDPTIHQSIHKLGLFTGLVSEEEIENFICKDLYPLHPVSSYLLPKISSIFGQNERTLYTFLNDDSNYGFIYLVNRNDIKIIYPDTLVSYFFSKIDPSYVDDKVTYSVYQDGINRLNSITEINNLELLKRIYSFIFIWIITNSNYSVKTSDTFIAFSLDIDVEKVQQSLKTLNIYKMIRFNVFLDQWELFSGSSLELDKEISTIILQENYSNGYILDQLNNFNQLKYIYAEKHNIKYDITRFIEFSFVDTKMIASLDKTINSDLFIPIFPVLSQKPDYSIYIELTKSIDNVLDLTKRILALHKLRNSHFIYEYANLEVEIEYYIQKANYDLAQQIEVIYKHAIFHVVNDVKQFESIQEIGDYFSNYFNDKYKHAIVIRNDQINMLQISRVQYKAIRNVVSKIIDYGSTHIASMFNGSKPEDLVFYSLFINPYIDNENRRNLKSLLSKMQLYLESNSKSKIFDIVDIGIKQPYGLRPYVSTIYALSVIAEKWKDIMFFMNDSFIPNLDLDTLLSESLKENSLLTYVYSKFDHKNRSFLEELQLIFPYSSDFVVNKSLSVRVCSGLYNWYISLPVITQQYVDLPISSVTLLKIIAKSRVNPEESITEILKSNLDSELISVLKRRIEEHLSSYIASFDQAMLLEIGGQDYSIWLKDKNPALLKDSKLANAIKNKLSLVSTFSDENDSIEVSRWTKSSFENLRNLLIQKNDELSGKTKYNKLVLDGNIKVVQDIELSKKAINTLMNIENVLESTRKYMTKAEFEKIIIILAQKYVR